MGSAALGGSTPREFDIFGRQSLPAGTQLRRDSRAARSRSGGDMFYNLISPKERHDFVVSLFWDSVVSGKQSMHRIDAIQRDTTGCILLLAFGTGPA